MYNSKHGIAKIDDRACLLCLQKAKLHEQQKQDQYSGQVGFKEILPLVQAYY